MQYTIIGQYQFGNHVFTAAEAFERCIIFPLKALDTRPIGFYKKNPFIMHLKAHKIVQQGSFFSLLQILQIRWPIEPKFSQVCYLMHVGIHQVGIRDNNQTCPVPLTCKQLL